MYGYELLKEIEILNKIIGDVRNNELDIQTNSDENRVVVNVYYNDIISIDLFDRIRNKFKEYGYELTDIQLYNKSLSFEKYINEVD